ncbi:MAG: hypothetical protein OEZ01_01765 [Candidatus Heimdallarchaeota archaeon]|nr:hypothetical protein [Candidatus Heimdallarchaeota archaeon]MDH5644700.1 hypothetical protein [Candidatus Heimdallarchaeota archaeon]
MNYQPSHELIEKFDKVFKTVRKNGLIIPFSIDTILKDMIDLGISPLQAIDIAYSIHPFLADGIDTKKIFQLISQSAEIFVPEKEIQNILKTVNEILLNNNTRIPFNYTSVRLILSNYLIKFQYSNSILKELTDEMVRVSKSLRLTEIKEVTIEKLIPAVTRNILGINPFIQERCLDDYKNTLNIVKLINNAWDLIPKEEKVSNLISLFNSIYRVILLSFNYLPGSNIHKTMSQVNKFVAEYSHKEHDSIQAKEIYLLGKSTKELLDILNHKDNQTIHLHVWLEFIDILAEVVKGLMNRGAMKWIIVVDPFGNELYAKFSTKTNHNRPLMAMALSGIQTMINELTDQSIKQIEHTEGSYLLIERRQLFSVLTMVDLSTHLVRQKLEALADYIEIELHLEIKEFRGGVKVFYTVLDKFIDEHLKNYI